MSKMKELYEKVAADSALQAKLNVILSDAEKSGESSTGDKLVAFAKEAGFDVKLNEMQDFFKEIASQKDGQLSESELDMVAGGKSLTGILNIAASAGSLGVACGIGSGQHAVAHAISSSSQSCGDCFK